MTGERSDREILADFRRHTGTSLRRMGWLFLIVMIYVAVCSALYGFAIRNGWLARYGISEGCIAFMPLPVVFGLMFLSGGKTDRLQRLEDLPERILRTQIDHYQRRWRSVLGALLLLLCVSAAAALHVTATASALADKAIFIGLFLLFALICALGSVFYPGLKVFDDERTQALRNRTAKFGFVVQLLIAAAALPFCLSTPVWAPQILIWSALAGGASPALYYIIADWRSDRDG